ncbi:MAG: hypothetical protein HXS41_08310 [Theionarchaea archaeon]|nr:hypothetical protein [Theionarchaea archaeon]MBU7001632.1 hypothetical protein [Theionarchaea archaeon]MBU7021049.1 hypothetical protein [Theionarchaea archaeon]
MEKQKRSGEKGHLQEIQEALAVVAVFVGIGWFYIEVLQGHQLFLFEIAAASTLVYLVVAICRQAKGTQKEGMQAFVISPVESKWTTELGNRIKRFTGIVAALSFLGAAAYMREKAFYLVAGILFLSSLAQFFLLKPRADIARNLLALFMIPAFMVGVFLLLGFFGPGVAALGLFLFLISFAVLVWGGGMDYLWKILKKRYGE